MDIIEAWDRAALSWSHREKLLLQLSQTERTDFQNTFHSRHLQELFVIRLFEYYRIYQNEFFIVEREDNILLAFLLNWTSYDAHRLSAIIYHHDYFSVFMNENICLPDHISLLRILNSINHCLLWTEIAIRFQSLNYNDYCIRLLLKFPDQVLNDLLIIVITRIYHNSYDTILVLIRDLLLYPLISAKKFGLHIFLYVITNPLNSEHLMRKTLHEGPSNLLELILCTLVKLDYGPQYKVRPVILVLLWIQ